MLKKIPESITISMYAFNVTINNIIYLPPEIIEVIYTFVIKEYYAKIIFKHWFNSKLVYNCLKFSIETLLNDNQYNYYINNDINIISTSHIEILEFLIKNRIARKYNLKFWGNYLQVLSSRISSLRFQQRCNNISFKSESGKKLKLVMNLWLELCKKFNFEINFQSRNSSKYIRAKNLVKIKNYDSYMVPPSIIEPFNEEFNDKISIYTHEALEFLQIRLLTM